MGEMVRFWIQCGLALGLFLLIVTQTVTDLAAVGFLIVCASTCTLTAVWSFVDMMDDV